MILLNKFIKIQLLRYFGSNVWSKPYSTSIYACFKKPNYLHYFKINPETGKLVSASLMFHERLEDYDVDSEYEYMEKRRIQYADCFEYNARFGTIGVYYDNIHINLDINFDKSWNNTIEFSFGEHCDEYYIDFPKESISKCMSNVLKTARVDYKKLKCFHETFSEIM